MKANLQIEPARVQEGMKRLARLCGIPGAVGAALLVGAISIQVTKLGPLEKALRVEEGRLQAQERQIQADRPKDALAQEAVAADVALMKSADFTEFLRRFDKLASDPQYQFKFSQMDFLQAREANGKLTRFSTQFQIQAPYLITRKFATDLLELPGVRLENINFSRPQIEVPAPVAQVRFSVLTENQ